MSSRSLGLSESVYNYMLAYSLRESPICRELRMHTELMTEGRMQISPEQGQFMAMLVSLLGVTKAIEIGTFTGYSALCVAQALPEDGILIACDISTEWTDIAQKHWKKAGIAHKVDLRVAPAIDTLATLSNQQDSFGFAFIDADKVNYLNYYEAIIPLLKPNGLLLIDNVLWSGAVADPNNTEESTKAIRTLNQHVYNDERVDISLLPVGDGLTLVRKKT